MPNNISNVKYLKYVRSLKCCHCHEEHAEAHHIIGVGMGCMGGKADDIHSVPLCREHHVAVHKKPEDWPQTKWLCETQRKAQKAGYL